jgi:prepilin-type N-terminal cleavage/methylation domain-containing protein
MIHQKQHHLPPSDQSGFTIIESLLAVIVAGILLLAIAPVIALSVATRLQAKRVEIATDAVRSYIDGVKTANITDPPITTRATGATTDPPSPDAPSGTLSCPSTGGICSISPAATSYQLYCFPGDTGGCSTDRAMIIQAFGYNPNSNTPQYGYKLGLRVYRADAFKSGITLQASKNAGITKQPTFTGGIGLSAIQAPLVETTTEISNGSTTFSNFCNRLQQPTPSPSSTVSPNPQSQC